jgi:hypothetical protein
VLRRRFTVPQSWSHEGTKQLWVQSWSGTTIGPDFALNLTPFVRYGEDNRIELICHAGDRAFLVRAVEFRFYDRGVYP